MEIDKVNISHPEKIMYPSLKITKADIAEYYSFIADWMIPRIKERPLSLKQYPGGIDGTGFFHKHAADFYPSFIKRFEFTTGHHGTFKMVGVKNAKGLVYLAAQNTIEIHMALAKMRKIRCPDQIILDFDPSEEDFSKVREVALIAKEILDQNNMLKTPSVTMMRLRQVAASFNFASKSAMLLCSYRKRCALHRRTPSMIEA